MVSTRISLLSLAAVALLVQQSDGFGIGPCPSATTTMSTVLFAEVSDLPQGISPFEKSLSKSLDIAGDFRKRSSAALKQAQKDGVRLMEIEFPPLLFSGKTQFDDFDNVQELNLNRDWCVEWMSALPFDGEIWFLLPDLKECELAKAEWTGGLYRDAARWTTIEAVTKHYTSDDGYSKPWGATFADGVSNIFANGELLGDMTALDALDNTPGLHLICQPGNGGPVEDWINCEILHNEASSDTSSLIVNGALDKVRDGYYPGVFFPKLAATVDRFYKKFESIFYLRPISDKGAYGWLYRVYPEPWQVVLQTVKTDSKDRQYVENTVVYTSESRPTFDEARQYLLAGAAQQQTT